MVMPSIDKEDASGIGHERTCPCGCPMIWSVPFGLWLCLHCDLDEVGQ